MRQPQVRPQRCTKQYDAFGNLTSSSGSWNGPFSYGGAFGYQSETDTGYQLLGHRYYDPTTGRFLTRDPIGDGRNWYAYCENNPVKFADPNGLAIWFIPLVAIALCAAWRVYDTYTTLSEIVADPTDWSNYVGFVPGVRQVKALWRFVKPLDDGSDVAKVGVRHASNAPKSPKPRKGAGSKLPIEGGPPNGSLVAEVKPGVGTIRDYFGAGRAKVDYDFGDTRHAELGDPHAHDWIWKGPIRGDGNPERGPARRLKPGE